MLLFPCFPFVGRFKLFALWSAGAVECKILLFECRLQRSSSKLVDIKLMMSCFIFCLGSSVLLNFYKMLPKMSLGRLLEIVQIDLLKEASGLVVR